MPRQSKPHVVRGWWRTRIKKHLYKLARATGPASERQAWAAFHRLMAAELEAPRTDRPQTVNGVIDRWLSLNPKDAYRRWLAPFQRYAGDEYLSTLPHDLLTLYYLHLGKARYRSKDRHGVEHGQPRPYTAETVRHFVRIAAAALTWAAAEGWCQAPRMPKVKAPVRRDRDIPPDRLDAILDGLPDGAGRIIRFIAATGCRPGEACKLQWRDVRLDAGVCELMEHKTADKTGCLRTIYLTPVAREILFQLTPTVGPVFLSRLGKPYTVAGLRSVLRQHGNITTYALRHSFAQRARESGVPVDALAALLGHRGTRMTAHYYAVRSKLALAAAEQITLSIKRPKAETAS